MSIIVPVSMVLWWRFDYEAAEESTTIRGCRFMNEVYSGPHTLRLMFACEKLRDLIRFEPRWRVNLPKVERDTLILRPVGRHKQTTHDGILYMGGAWRFQPKKKCLSNEVSNDLPLLVS